MTSYTPNPVVTFNGGLTYSDQTIANISVSMGRLNIFEQPQTGFASIQLWSDASQPIDVSLSEKVVVTIDKGTTGTQDIFTGIVSDIDITLEAYGDVGSIAKYSITAVGPLAQLNKRLAGLTGFAKEFDGTRVYNILYDAFSTTWDEASPTADWNDLPNGVSWDDADGVTADLFDQISTNITVPGQYEIMAYNSGSTNALSLAQDAAQSGRGILYETGDGQIWYQDYQDRITNPSFELTDNDLLTNGLRTAAQWSEIVNAATVTYRAGQESFRDETSIFAYGELSGSRDTSLHNAADALSQAETFTDSRAFPRVYPDVMSVALHSPTVTDATRDNLAAVYCGARVFTNDLPMVFNQTFDGFVEGYTWRITRYEAFVELTCSAYSESFPKIVWFQIPPTTTWATYNPTTRWSDL